MLLAILRAFSDEFEKIAEEGRLVYLETRGIPKDTKKWRNRGAAAGGVAGGLGGALGAAAAGRGAKEKAIMAVLGGVGGGALGASGGAVAGNKIGAGISKRKGDIGDVTSRRLVRLVGPLPRGQ